MSKPIGPICNLDCSYCFYLEKEQLFPKNEQFRMSDEVLEAYLRSYLASQDGPEVTFAWQGGEPLLLGLDFFRKVVRLQGELTDGRPIGNTIQTNATLIDEAWAAFFAEHDFLVGVSLDGPRELHDAYRVDKRGTPTFDQVMEGLARLKKYEVRFNLLTVVSRTNASDPLGVYHFLKEVGAGFIQFIPLVERQSDERARTLGLGLATPPGSSPATSPVTRWTVEPHAFGNFLIAIFDDWVRHDVGSISVGISDEALRKWAGIKGGMCVFNETCGDALAMEHNGDLYSCDHYVYPEYRLGNILEEPLRELAGSPAQRKFGQDKRDTLPAYCRGCEVRFACQGECPKHRFETTPDGEPGLNYLCAGYKKFFTHVNGPMQVMARLWHEGRAPEFIMDLMAEKDRVEASQDFDGRDHGSSRSGHAFEDCRTDQSGAESRNT